MMSHCFTLKTSDLTLGLQSLRSQVLHAWDHMRNRNETLKPSCNCLYNHCCFVAWSPLCWSSDLVWCFRSSQLPPPSSHLTGVPPETHCPIVSELDDMPSGTTWDMNSWEPSVGWLVVQCKSSGGYVSLMWTLTNEKWEMRGSQNQCFLVLVDGYKVQFLLASLTGGDPHAKWKRLLKNLLSVFMVFTVVFSG